MNRIKELREEKNLFQDDLAKALGTTRTAISFYENNQRKLTSEIIIKLAEFFDVSTDYLLGKSDERNIIEDTRIKVGLNTEDYKEITDEQKRQIEEFARFILKDNLKKRKR